MPGWPVNNPGSRALPSLRILTQSVWQGWRVCIFTCSWEMLMVLVLDHMLGSTILSESLEGMLLNHNEKSLKCKGMY